MNRFKTSFFALLACCVGSTASANTFDVTQSGFGFSPSNVTIEVGDTVRWLWTSTAHTVTEGTDGTYDGNELFHSDLDSNTTMFSVTFDAALVSANPRPGGVYDYFCIPHYPIMTGTVTVTEPGTPYCFGDGLDTVVTATCPCTNFGAVGAGCGNSFSSLGGLLSATGTTSPNTVLFTASRLPNNTLTVGFRNTTNTSPGGVVFGDGVRCQSGVLIRFGAHNSGTGGDAPNTWTFTPTTVVGATRYYQVQYRNSAPTFCPPATFNITNGYSIAWP